jgi:hypothetical protein
VTGLAAGTLAAGTVPVGVEEGSTLAPTGVAVSTTEVRFPVTDFFCTLPEVPRAARVALDFEAASALVATLVVAVDFGAVSPKSPRIAIACSP